MINNFGFDEPVLTKELYARLDMNKNTIRQLLKRGVDSGEIERYKYKDGIYFVPNKNSLLKKNTLSFKKVISKEYLIREGRQIGYITGLAFSNQLQLTTQNPATIEIVTQGETMFKREVDYNFRKVTLRKPRVKEINNKNFKILQVLDLLNNFENLSAEPIEKATYTIQEYVSDIKIDREELNRYVKEYPLKAQIKALENGFFNEVTL